MNRNRSSNPVYSKMIKCSFFRIIVLLPTRVAPITKKNTSPVLRPTPTPTTRLPLTPLSARRLLRRGSK